MTSGENGYNDSMATIMIVEDNLDSCEVLVNFLQKVGHKVRCHPNGKDALVAVITDPPDVEQQPLQRREPAPAVVREPKHLAALAPPQLADEGQRGGGRGHAGDGVRHRVAVRHQKKPSAFGL